MPSGRCPRNHREKKEKIRPAREGCGGEGPLKCRGTAGPPEGLLDARKDAARTRATNRWRPSCAPVNGGGRQQQQQPVVVSARQLRVLLRNPLFLSVSHARAHWSYRRYTYPWHTRSHPRVTCRASLAFPSAESAWELDEPARASSSERVPLSLAQCPFDSRRFNVTRYIGVLY